MRIYLDICCLKRPFDDQLHPRIAAETAAILGILAQVESRRIEAVCSPAHLFENSLNPDVQRAAAVHEWVAGRVSSSVPGSGVEVEFARLRGCGLGQFDALHVAWACALKCHVFISVDDRLLSRGARALGSGAMRVLGPMEFVKEVSR
ncbi:MAG: hypothetical protein KF699_04915 [Phycisphaeraceae bacterium]|nr:hypothetical protein [Phycisphaeraceae bacterium]MBX3405392.1 hypothetical protein [Phycisphaeraceae bacterium]